MRRTAANRAHPRMRGEHLVGDVVTRLPRGSSPHARGALDADRIHPLQRGLIPACAGSTLTPAYGLAPPRAHPACAGSTGLDDARLLRLQGSSPHARGAQAGRDLDGASGGLIPACAGSTERSKRLHYAKRAHPRVRGEHRFFDGRDDIMTGSSPRARGARATRCVRDLSSGLIPACAGSTSPTPKPPATCGAHPRVRGEHGQDFVGMTATWGSSPRARGAHFLTCGFSAPNPGFHSLSIDVPR